MAIASESTIGMLEANGVVSTQRKNRCWAERNRFQELKQHPSQYFLFGLVWVLDLVLVHLPSTCSVATFELGIFSHLTTLWINVPPVFSLLVFQNFLPHTYLSITLSFTQLGVYDFKTLENSNSLFLRIRKFGVISTPNKEKNGFTFREGHFHLYTSFSVGDKKFVDHSCRRMLRNANIVILRSIYDLHVLVGCPTQR